MGIQQQIEIEASPSRVYGALTDSAQFRTMSGGAPTEFSAEEGGFFSFFGGMIVGRNLELLPDERIVQAWRAANWEPGVYSTVRFELQPAGSGTRIVFDQQGHPEDQKEHLESGWHANYWEPLRKYLG